MHYPQWAVTIQLRDEGRTVVRAAVEAADETEAIVKAMLRWENCAFLKVEPVYQS